MRAQKQSTPTHAHTHKPTAGAKLSSREANGECRVEELAEPHAVEGVYATIDPAVDLCMYTCAPKLARTHRDARTQIKCFSRYYVGALIAAGNRRMSSSELAEACAGDVLRVST